MITISKRGDKELQVGNNFDDDNEIQFVLSSDSYEINTWLDKVDVKRLIEHLQNLL